jgi:molecular chaperone Hsp33
MSVSDYLVRAIARNANVRGLACVGSVLVNEACKRHDAYPTACAALGRALTGGALMGALLKTGQSVALKFEGNGPIGKIIVEAESDGSVRGYVGRPHTHLPLKNGKLDVAGALGRAGLLTVTKDLRLKEPYTGIVPLYTGEIAEDIAFYLTDSEQIPSAMGLGVFVGADGRVSAAGGFLIQAFPPYEEETVEGLIKRIEAMPPPTEVLRQGRTPEDMLETIFEGLPFDILETRGLLFRCSCSRERAQKALIAMGPEEVRSLLEQHGGAEITCEFCREAYQLGGEELQALLAEMTRTSH